MRPAGGGGGGGGGGGVSPAQLCRQAVDGRFPFVAGSANEIPMDDFARLFAPGGMLDSFFNTQLRPFVDMSGRIWRPQAVDGVPSPVGAEAVANFQRAAVIRDIFFAGRPQPSFRFDISPAQLDAGARQATLDLDGVVITYAHGPTRSTSVTWPGQNRMNNVRLVFDPPPSSGSGVLQANGPWSLIRLFQQGRIQGAGAAERFTLSLHRRRSQHHLRDPRGLHAQSAGQQRPAGIPVPGAMTAPRCRLAASRPWGRA